MIILAAGAIASAACSQKCETTLSGLKASDFAAERDGKQTALYVLKNASGMEVCVTNFGGRIVSIEVPDKDGKMQDVVLGFDTVSDYFPENHSSDFGAFIGRYANRIAFGKFCLDGKEYELEHNDGNHCIHGGFRGWQYAVTDVVEADESHIKLALVSPDGDGKFPGEVKVSVVYTLTDDNKINIDYEAQTDAPTIINVTNHSYFNLSGDPANHKICEDNLYINASGFTPIDDTFRTSGEILPVEGTPFDFRTYTKIGDGIDADDEQIRNGKGYDHNWVLDTEGDISKVAASLYCPATGIQLDVYTDQPGLQVYCGNFLDGTVIGKKGVAYQQRTAICLESQHYPDSPNKPQWPSVVLRPGETYKTSTVFAFSVK